MMSNFSTHIYVTLFYVGKQIISLETTRISYDFWTIILYTKFVAMEYRAGMAFVTSRDMWASISSTQMKTKHVGAQ